MRRSSPSESLIEPTTLAQDDSTCVTTTEEEPVYKRARSCAGLADLVDVREDCNKPAHQQKTDVPLSPSNLYLRNKYTNEDEESSEPLRLWLPSKGSLAKLDEYLSRIPRVVSRAEELLQEEEDAQEEAVDNNCNKSCCSESSLPAPLKQADHHRCLNVLQGEVAHVSSEQADIVFSAEATTCHVIALRSTSTLFASDKNQQAPPFVSLAHIDQAYNACLENMIQEHLNHHDDHVKHASQQGEPAGLFMEDANFMQEQLPSTSSRRKASFIPDLVFEEELPQDLFSVPPPPPSNVMVDMELHIAGGYLDNEGLSQKISTQIIERFDDLAHKYSDRIKISLSTAAISCLNNDVVKENDNETPKNKPKSRGLGIDTRTGQVFAIKSSLPARLQGPGLEIRSARAFSTQSAPSLAVIHDRSCRKGEIRINPFCYQQRQDLNILLELPDQVLLSVASTSPEHESHDFCTNFRRTLSFVNTVPAETVFGGNKPLVYVRSTGDLNEWEQEQNEEDDGALMF